MGRTNWIAGHLREDAGRAEPCVRPETIEVMRLEAEKHLAGTTVGRIVEVTPLGPIRQIPVERDGGDRLLVAQPNRADQSPAPGEPVAIAVPCSLPRLRLRRRHHFWRTLMIPNSTKTGRIGLAAAALLIAGSPAARADGLADIQKAGTLKVGVFEDFPPFSSVGSDMSLKGYDIDVATGSWPTQISRSSSSLVEVSRVRTVFLTLPGIGSMS